MNPFVTGMLQAFDMREEGLDKEAVLGHLGGAALGAAAAHLGREHLEELAAKHAPELGERYVTEKHPLLSKIPGVKAYARRAATQKALRGIRQYGPLAGAALGATFLGRPLSAAWEGMLPELPGGKGKSITIEAAEGVSKIHRTRDALDRRFKGDGPGLARMARSASRGLTIDHPGPGKPRREHGLSPSDHGAPIYEVEGAQQWLEQHNGPREEMGDGSWQVEALKTGSLRDLAKAAAVTGVKGNVPTLATGLRALRKRYSPKPRMQEMGQEKQALDAADLLTAGLAGTGGAIGGQALGRRIAGKGLRNILRRYRMGRTGKAVGGTAAAGLALHRALSGPNQPVYYYE